MATHPWLTHYGSLIPHHLSYPHQDVFALLRGAANQHLDKPAIAFMGAKITYAQLMDQIERLAGALARRGVHKGSRVILMTPNSPQLVAAFFALLRMGAVPVLSPLIDDADELIARARQCGATGLVVQNCLPESLSGLRNKLGLDLIVCAGQMDGLGPSARLAQTFRRRLRPASPDCRVVREAGVERFARLLKENAQPPQRPVLNLEAPAAIVHTRGAGGRPRAVVLSHRALAANLCQAAAWLRLNPGDGVLVLGPLIRGLGLCLGLGAALIKGGCLILPSHEGPRAALAAMARRKPRFVAAEPGQLAALADLPEARKLPKGNLAAMVCDGPAPAADFAERVGELTGAALMESYGLAEAGAMVAATPPGGQRRGGALAPLMDVEMIIAGPDGQGVAPGQAGEIWLRGPGLMSGYQTGGRPDDQILRDGWLPTGDLGRLDQDGLLSVLGRTQDFAAQPRPLPADDRPAPKASRVHLRLCPAPQRARAASAEG